MFLVLQPFDPIRENTDCAIGAFTRLQRGHQVAMVGDGNAHERSRRPTYSSGSRKTYFAAILSPSFGDTVACAPRRVCSDRGETPRSAFGGSAQDTSRDPFNMAGREARLVVWEQAMNPLLEEQVLHYVRFEFLGEHRFLLKLLAQVHDPPLLGEGVWEIYAFQSSLGSERDYYVVASSEAVTSYPRGSLSADDIWAVHVAVQVSRRTQITASMVVGDEEQRYLAEASALVELRFGYGAARDSKIILERLYFVRGEGSHDEHHVVGRVVRGAREWQFVVGDVPHALYHLDATAHLVWTLHFGRLLLGLTPG